MGDNKQIHDVNEFTRVTVDAFCRPPVDMARLRYGPDDMVHGVVYMAHGLVYMARPVSQYGPAILDQVRDKGYVYVSCNRIIIIRNYFIWYHEPDSHTVTIVTPLSS